LRNRRVLTRADPFAVSELCQNSICWKHLGYLLSEKQIPQVIVNIRKQA
jgi:hypothetical protein